MFRDAQRYYTNKGMLSRVAGRWHNIYLTPQRPSYHYYSSNYTYPTVKRCNPYMACMILFHLHQVGSDYQVTQAGDTTNIPHAYIVLNERFGEWNPNFSQETG